MERVRRVWKSRYGDRRVKISRGRVSRVDCGMIWLAVMCAEIVVGVGHIGADCGCWGSPSLWSPLFAFNIVDTPFVSLVVKIGDMVGFGRWCGL